MPRYKLTIEYDGAPFCGWQVQDDRPTVQGELEKAALKFCGAADIVAAGRTDAGVHALAQVVHIDIDREFDPFRVMQGINFYLFNPVGCEAAAQDLIAQDDPALHTAYGRRIDNRIAVVAAAQVSERARKSKIKS